MTHRMDRVYEHHSTAKRYLNFLADCLTAYQNCWKMCQFKLVRYVVSEQWCASTLWEICNTASKPVV